MGKVDAFGNMVILDRANVRYGNWLILTLALLLAKNFQQEHTKLQRF